MASVSFCPVRISRGGANDELTTLPLLVPGGYLRLQAVAKPLLISLAREEEVLPREEAGEGVWSWGVDSGGVDRGVDSGGDDLGDWTGGGWRRGGNCYD